MYVCMCDCIYMYVDMCAFVCLFNCLYIYKESVLKMIYKVQNKNCLDMGYVSNIRFLCVDDLLFFPFCGWECTCLCWFVWIFHAGVYVGLCEYFMQVFHVCIFVVCLFICLYVCLYYMFVCLFVIKLSLYVYL
jgi:hypothetical protein